MFKWFKNRKLPVKLYIDGSYVGRFPTTDEALDYVHSTDYRVFRMTKYEDGYDKWAGDGFKPGVTGAEIIGAGVDISSSWANHTF